mgnify:CR=1 FL=1
MKIEKLNEVLNTFQENSDRAILIDGPWGCGKTHCILDFLKEKKKNKKTNEKSSSIVYISLFGKTSVDEIHTELYRNFHKAKHIGKLITNMIPKISGLFGEAGKFIENLEYTKNISSPVNETPVFGIDIDKSPHTCNSRRKY